MWVLNRTHYKTKEETNYRNIESNYPKENYRVDITMLNDNIPADNKNLLMMVDNFSKLGWVVLIYSNNFKPLLMQLNFDFPYMETKFISKW